MTQHTGSTGRTVFGVALLLVCGLMGVLHAPAGRAPSDDASDKIEQRAAWTSRLGSTDGLPATGAGGAYRPTPAAPPATTPGWKSLCSGSHCGSLTSGAGASLPDPVGWDAGWDVRGGGRAVVADVSALEALPANLVPGPFTGGQATTLNLLSPEALARPMFRDDPIPPLPAFGPQLDRSPVPVSVPRSPATPTPAEDSGTGSLQPVDIATDLPAEPRPTGTPATPATPRSTDATAPDAKHNDPLAGKPRGRANGPDTPVAAPAPSSGLPAGASPPARVPAGANPRLPDDDAPLGDTTPWAEDTPSNPAWNPFDPNGPLSQGLPPIPSSTPTIPGTPTVTPAPYQPLNNPTPVLERIALGREDPADSPSRPYDGHQDWPDQAIVAAVAEPGSLALMGVALLALGLIGRLRSR